jgi:uncharacterized protein
MKLALLLLFLPFIAHSQNQYIKNVLEHRKETNAEYKDTLRSPLKNNQVAVFDSLNYFYPIEKWKIQAIFTKEIGGPFDMTTSAGKTKRFRQYGKLRFIIEGAVYELAIYQNLQLMTNPIYKDYIFIPFTDLTNGEETYGGGRYIEAKTPTSGVFELDFNYCFNPYCHYTTGYNCPIPPKENFLDLKIEAGEKVYKEH